MKPSSRGVLLSVISAIILLPVPSRAEPVPLRRIVELALSHATAGAIAAADEQRAAAAYRDVRDSYIPQVTLGAGLGPPSYGFPLSLEGQPPSLFNINAQSSVLNASLRQFLKAARVDSTVAALRTKDQRNQILQDAAQSYAELAKWERRLQRLGQTEEDEKKMEAAVAERVKEGVDSQVESFKARLSAARVRLRITEAQGAAEVLREHLSKLTGLPAADIQTDPDSIPAAPPAPATAADLPKGAVYSSPAVEAAVEHARAQYLRARGEHKALWPTFDFAAQYTLLSTFNNFQNYYIPSKPCVVAGVSVLCVTDKFRQNNASVGISIRFPLFNASQRARAKAADADALKASKQAEVAENQTSEETLRLERSVAQLQAAHEVAELEAEIAQKNLTAVQTRVDAGTANLHDLDDARTQLSERFVTLEDVSFELERAQLGLLRSTGELEKWALGK